MDGSVMMCIKQQLSSEIVVSDFENKSDGYYDETELMSHRLVTRLLIEISIFIQVASYVWMVIPPRNEDELVLKIVLLGFVGSLFFLALCVVAFFRQRAYRAQWTSFDRTLYRCNGILAMYPFFMGALIYYMASINP